MRVSSSSMASELFKAQTSNAAQASIGSIGKQAASHSRCCGTNMATAIRFRTSSAAKADASLMRCTPGLRRHVKEALRGEAIGRSASGPGTGSVAPLIVSFLEANFRRLFVAHPPHLYKLVRSLLWRVFAQQHSQRAAKLCCNLQTAHLGGAQRGCARLPELE
jgi:hypothetical protein